MASIDTHLGKQSQYDSKYNPDILVREKRDNNRILHHIDASTFIGYDVWNVYEVSFLTNNGLPITGVGKIVYPSNNPYIVESKSLKLYFFSYNMEKMGNNVDNAIKILTNQVKQDLSALLETDVDFTFFNASVNHIPKALFNPNEGFWPKPFTFKNIDNINGIEDIIFTDFKENKSLLQVNTLSNTITESFSSCMLRSNCKITHQPDWADLFIYYKGVKELDKISTIKYIVSFRNESHFHEEITESVYSALYTALQPEELMVCALYTRRGGIDINPIRASHGYLLDQILIDANTIMQKTARQ
jgi:7-cyano-7-deazaguanine reductase